jgi:hypothetical protein
MPAEHKPERADLASEVAMGTLILGTMGVVHGWVFFSHFGINIFDYLSVADFVVLALKTWWAVLYATAACLLLLFFGQSKWIWLGMVLFGAVISAAAAASSARDILSSNIVISDRQPCTLDYDGMPNGKPQTGVIVLGTAGDFLIFYTPGVSEPDEPIGDGSTHLIGKSTVHDLSCPKAV